MVPKGNLSPQTVGSGLSYVSTDYVARTKSHSLGVNTLDISGENICLGLGGARGQQNVVGVPVNRQNSRPQRLFDMF